jgi:hypothetical protein
VNHRRRVVSACLAVLAAGALGACSSTPSNPTVVREVIESLQLPDDQEQCMLDKLENDYTDDQINQIADDNEDWDPAGQGDTPADASEGMQLFIEDFHECTTEGGAAGETSGSSTPTESTTPVESTAPAESTTPAESTAPAETTEG